MSLRPIPMYRICSKCGKHFIDDGATLNRNTKNFLKCPYCGSDSVEDNKMQNQKELKFTILS